MVGKIIGYVTSVAFIFLGVLYLWAAPVRDTGTRLIIGLALVGVGLGIVFLVRMRVPKPVERIDGWMEPPDEQGPERLYCRNCGGGLDEGDFSISQGVMTVRCPHCRAEYQIEEEPKW